MNLIYQAIGLKDLHNYLKWAPKAYISPPPPPPQIFREVSATVDSTIEGKRARQVKQSSENLNGKTKN